MNNDHRTGRLKRKDATALNLQSNKVSVISASATDELITEGKATPLFYKNWGILNEA